MPINESPDPSSYHPSEKETEIVGSLFEASDRGLSYTEIKTHTGLSDTGLTKLLKRLNRFDLIIKDKTGRYLVGLLGIRYLLSLKITDVPPEKVKRRKATLAHSALWDQVHELHERVIHRSGDWASKLLQSTSQRDNPTDVWWVAAFQTGGKKHLAFRSATLQELRNLGVSTGKA